MGTAIIRIAILLENCTIAIMNMERGFKLTDKFKVGNVYNRFVLSPNPTNPYLIYSDEISQGIVKLYHMEKKITSNFLAHINPIMMMAISTDGKMLATASCNVRLISGTSDKNI